MATAEYPHDQYFSSKNRRPKTLSGRKFNLAWKAKVDILAKQWYGFRKMRSVYSCKFFFQVSLYCKNTCGCLIFPFLICLWPADVANSKERRARTPQPSWAE